MAGTIRQIAELAGVSRGTVDRALNNRGRINPLVAERIHEIAEKLDYRVHPGTRKAKEKIKIGVITQLSDTPFMAKVLNGIKDVKEEMQERHVTLLVKNNSSVDGEDQLRAIDALVKDKVLGIAIMPVDCEAVRVRINRLIEEENIPVVTFNTDIVGTKRECYVGLDNRKSGYTAAGLMGMLTGQKGKVLIITGAFTNSVNSLRVEGFIEEIKKTFPEMELLGVQSSLGGEEEVEKILINTMTQFPDLAGVFVACNGQQGVCQAYQKMKIKKRPATIVYDLVPENIQALEAGWFDFLIDQEGYVQGYKAINMLYDRIVRGRIIKDAMFFTEINIKTKYNV